MVLGIFKITLRLRDWHIFQSVKILNVFKTLKQIFWKTKIFLKKLEYSFLVESTKIENVSFPYKTATSEANVKTNSLLTTKWTYHKERSFLFIYFFFWKFCFSLTTSYKKLICCTNNPNVHICTFCKCWSFIWRCFFPVSILKTSRYASLVCNLFETFSFFLFAILLFCIAILNN